MGEERAGYSVWDARRVRALREALGDSQQAFADRLGTRQQTVSEWERGTSRPARMAQRLLTLIAEAAPAYFPGHEAPAPVATSEGTPPS